LNHVQFLTRLVELELPGGVRRQTAICAPPARPRATDGRAPQFKLVRASRSNGPGDHLKAQNAAKFPAKKSLDSFDFKAIPKLNKMQVLELARCDWIERRENVIALGLGLAACQKGMTVSFTTAAALVNELLEARDERRLLRVPKQMANAKLLIIDTLGFVPLSKTGAELLFELISQHYERARCSTA
jgi:hypothetical protein